MQDEAILSSKGLFTSFFFNGHVIHFRTSAKLERYTKILEWDNGYIVVMAKYQNHEEMEEYIDLIPILENLLFNPEEFFKKKINICIL